MRLMRLLAILSLFVIIGMEVVQAQAESNIETKAVKKVPPIYPPLAKRKRVESKVKVSLKINPDGSVSAAEFTDGNSMFKPVSLDAAKQWQFQKSSAGMSGYITFNFEIKED